MKNNLHPVKDKSDTAGCVESILAFFFIACAIVTVLWLTSCSTTKQKSVTKSRTSTTVDSSSNTSTSSTVDSGRVEKEHTITTVTTDDSTVTVTVVEYNNDSTVLDAIFNRGSNGTATDYIQPIRTITTRTATRARGSATEAKDVEQAATHHSTTSSTVRIQVRNTSELSTYTKNKEVSRWNWAWLLVIPAALRMYYNHKYNKPLIS